MGLNPRRIGGESAKSGMNAYLASYRGMLLKSPTLTRSRSRARYKQFRGQLSRLLTASVIGLERKQGILRVDQKTTMWQSPWYWFADAAFSALSSQLGLSSESFVATSGLADTDE